MYIIELGVSFFVFVAVTLVTMIILTPKRAAIRARLDGYTSLSGAGDMPDELAKPFFDRLILPGLQRLAAVINRAAPDTIAKETARELQRAGNPANLSVGTFLLIKAALLVALPVTYGVYLLQSNEAGIMQVGVWLVLFYVGFRLPDLWLGTRISERRQAITRTLPDALDLLIICIEAGMAFEGAMSRVAERMVGPLSEEFRRALTEMSMGQRRRDALRDMAERSQTPDLISFVAVVVQADQTGVSIGQVLRVQADALRVRRRLRAKEEGAKAPLKMLFPLIFFILPATFAVLLGPAALTVMDNFINLGV